MIKCLALEALNCAASLALQQTDAALVPSATPQKSLLISTLIALGGLVPVVMVGRFLVDGAVSLARGLGISETVIGLTIVAVGTSMPEFVTSVVAGLRKQGDVALRQHRRIKHLQCPRDWRHHGADRAWRGSGRNCEFRQPRDDRRVAGVGCRRVDRALDRAMGGSGIARRIRRLGA